VIVLFGATGDLAKRKLLPGLAFLSRQRVAQLQIARSGVLIRASRDCVANGVFGPTRRAEVRRDGHCE
jgi:glucose-6-phosphate 1-dehydrogenase